MAPNSVQKTRQIICKLMSRCTKLRDWRSLVLEGVSSLSTIFNCTKRGDYCALIGDCVRTCVVSHLNAEATQLAMGGIYFFEERSRNVNMIAGLLFKGSDATLVQSRVCLTAPIFTSARACGHQALTRTPSQGTTHTPMISLDRLVCRAYGAQALKRRSVKIHRSQPACRQHQRPRCSLRIIGMLWTGRSCRRRQCWLWRKRERATGPASAPKLRQNRFKCNRYLLRQLAPLVPSYPAHLTTAAEPVRQSQRILHKCSSASTRLAAHCSTQAPVQIQKSTFCDLWA